MREVSFGWSPEDGLSSGWSDEVVSQQGDILRMISCRWSLEGGLKDGLEVDLLRVVSLQDEHGLMIERL